jgi:hypothetical protein
MTEQRCPDERVASLAVVDEVRCEPGDEACRARNSPWGHGRCQLLHGSDDGFRKLGSSMRETRNPPDSGRNIWWDFKMVDN